MEQQTFNISDWQIPFMLLELSAYKKRQEEEVGLQSVKLNSDNQFSVENKFVATSAQIIQTKKQIKSNR